MRITARGAVRLKVGEFDNATSFKIGGSEVRGPVPLSG
jgi:hypothetical protein